MTEPGVHCPRRYCLLKRFAARDRRDVLFEGVWRAKQEETSGTALDEAFPYQAKLAAAGYTAREDLVGATSDELMKRASLKRREAEAALAALETS